MFCRTFLLLISGLTIKSSKSNGFKRVNELQIPSISAPNGGKPANHLKDQLRANFKYLKKLQVDMDRQVNKVNQEFIDEQPVDPKHINQTKKYPNNHPTGDELERLVSNQNTFDVSNHQPAAPFSLSKIVHHVLQESQNTGHAQKDLISNMDVKGNMDQLKALMKTMANDVQEANIAILDRQKKKHKKEMEKLQGKGKKENKGKN